MEYFALVIGNIFIPTIFYSIMYKIFALLFMLSFLLPLIFTEIMDNVMKALPFLLDYLALLLSLIIIIPIFSVGVRRFHDLSVSGKLSAFGSSLIAILILIPNYYIASLDLIWYLSSLYLVICFFVFLIIFLVICLLPGRKYINQYGQRYIYNVLFKIDDEF